jgi:2-keto-myo-inositol isomerase
VDARDRLGNIAQIKALIDGGFEGAFSYEPFSPEVHSLKDPKAALRASMDYIAKAVA